MHRCKEMWKSIADFLINKLGGVTKEDHEADLLAEHQLIHYDRRPIHTATITAEAKWQHDGIGAHEREYLAKEIGVRLLAEGFIHFNVKPLSAPELYPVPITVSRATVRAVKPTSQGFGYGYEAEGLFIDEDLIHVQHK